jgi:hypothetical protein
MLGGESHFLEKNLQRFEKLRETGVTFEFQQYFMIEMTRSFSWLIHHMSKEPESMERKWSKITFSRMGAEFSTSSATFTMNS